MTDKRYTLFLSLGQWERRREEGSSAEEARGGPSVSQDDGDVRQLLLNTASFPHLARRALLDLQRPFRFHPKAQEGPEKQSNFLAEVWTPGLSCHELMGKLCGEWRVPAEWASGSWHLMWFPRARGALFYLCSKASWELMVPWPWDEAEKLLVEGMYLLGFRAVGRDGEASSNQHRSLDVLRKCHIEFSFVSLIELWTRPRQGSVLIF